MFLQHYEPNICIRKTYQKLAMKMKKNLEFLQITLCLFCLQANHNSQQGKRTHILFIHLNITLVLAIKQGGSNEMWHNEKDWQSLVWTLSAWLWLYVDCWFDIIINFHYLELSINEIIVSTHDFECLISYSRSNVRVG